MDIEEYKRFIVALIKEREQLLDESDIQYIEGLLDGLELAASLIRRS